MNTKSKRSMVKRIRERFRYGLALQEVIDVLQRRFNIMVYPYYVVAENLNENCAPNYDEVPPFSIRYLQEKDMESVMKIRPWMSTLAKLQSDIQLYDCLGIAVEEQLAGTTWSRDDVIPVPNSGQPLVELGSDEAYLFDAFVGREYRGYRLAPIVRHQLYCELVKIGKTQFYSITLAFNKSSRRFKAKLGAREIELRLMIGIAGWKAIDFRLTTKENIKITPRCKLLNLKRTHNGVR